MFDNYGALRNLVAFVQFKKREKHPWNPNNDTSSSNPIYVRVNLVLIRQLHDILESMNVLHIHLDCICNGKLTGSLKAKQ